MNRKTLKKRICIIALVTILCAILFIPRKITYRDGGTVDYRALTYRVIKWHKIAWDNPHTGEVNYITGMNVYLFPFNFADIDDLYKKKVEASQ